MSVFVFTTISHVALSQDRILTVTQSSPAIKVYSFNAAEHKNKIHLEWIIGENENANHIEVERSVDGKNFSTVALVLCSETIGKERYKFFEAAPKALAMYRLKIFDKNSKINYSQVLLLKTGI